MRTPPVPRSNALTSGTNAPIVKAKSPPAIESMPTMIASIAIIVTIKNRLETYVDEHFPFEHNVCNVGVNKILRKAWDIANSDSNVSYSQIMQALSLAKDCYRMKLELLDSEAIVDKAIQFVESRKEEINGTLQYFQNETVTHSSNII
jgi:hypothetical protein